MFIQFFIADIEFVRFKVRDMDNGEVLFEINKPAPGDTADGDGEGDEEEEDDEEEGGPPAAEGGEGGALPGGGGENGEVKENQEGGGEKGGESENEEGNKAFTPRFIRYYFKPSFLRLR